MRCERCQGKGLVVKLGPSMRHTFQDGTEIQTADFSSSVPCPDCGGSGFSHCCDGITACNDPPGGEQ